MNDAVNSKSKPKVNIVCATRLLSLELAQQLKRQKLLGKLYSGAIVFGKRGHVSDYGLEPSDIAYHRLPTLVAHVLRRFGPEALNSFWRYRHHNAFGRWCERAMAPADVVHAWSHMALETFRWARRNGAIGVLDRSAAHGYYWRDVLTEEFAKWGGEYRCHKATEEKAAAEYEEADAIIVPSQFCKQTLIDYGVSDAKIHRVPFGTKVLGAGPRRRPSKIFRVLYIGGLRVLKGIPYFFQAAEMLKDLPDIEFILVGGGAEAPIAKLLGKHQDHVRYVGFKAKAELFSEIYPSGSVLVQPSLLEGMSYVVIEALSHGLPVIVTPNTGAEDFITDGQEGLVVPIRSAEAIAEKIRLLYEDRHRLEEMSEAAFELSHGLGWSWDDYGQSVEKVYQSTMEKLSQ